jgi:hypothetical protein
MSRTSELQLLIPWKRYTMADDIIHYFVYYFLQFSRLLENIICLQRYVLNNYACNLVTKSQRMNLHLVVGS